MLVVDMLIWAAWFASGIREKDGEYYDAIEDDPGIQPILRAAEKEARENLKDHPRNPNKTKDPGVMGFTHVYWDEKKRILSERYGIRWRTRAQLNPCTAYD
jgi:hypothetical protein